MAIMSPRKVKNLRIHEYLSSDHELTKMGLVRNTKIYKRHDPFLQGTHNLIKKLGLRSKVSSEGRLPAGRRIHTCWRKVLADLCSSRKKGFLKKLSPGTLGDQFFKNVWSF